MTLPVTLQWAHVPNPQIFGYTVEIAKDPAFKNIEDTEVQESFPSVTIDSLTPGTKYWRVFSDQGDDAPATVDSAGLPAVTAPSATGTFTVSTAPATPVSLALEGVDAPQAVTGGTNFFDGAAAHGGDPGGRRRRHPDQLEPRGGAGPGDAHDGRASAGAISRSRSARSRPRRP